MPLLRARREAVEDAASHIVDGLVMELIDDELLPALLSDAILSEGGEYDPLPVEEQIAADVLRSVIDEVVPALVRDAAKAAISNLVATALADSAHDRYVEPDREVAQAVLDDVVLDFVSR